MEVICENDMIELNDKNQKMTISYNNDSVYISSNDVNGLTVKTDDNLWIIINNLFNDLMCLDNTKTKSLTKYEDSLIKIKSNTNYSNLVFAKILNDFVFSVVSPKERIVEFNTKNNDIGRIILNFYNNLLLYTKGSHQITMDEYVYTLSNKNVTY